MLQKASKPQNLKSLEVKPTSLYMYLLPEVPLWRVGGFCMLFFGSPDFHLEDPYCAHAATTTYVYLGYVFRPRVYSMPQLAYY